MARKHTVRFPRQTPEGRCRRQGPEHMSAVQHHGPDRDSDSRSEKTDDRVDRNHGSSEPVGVVRSDLQGQIRRKRSRGPSEEDVRFGSHRFEHRTGSLIDSTLYAMTREL